MLVVVGLALLFGYAGQISLGHAAFVGIGAYTCAFCTTTLALPWLLAFAAAGAVVGASAASSSPSRACASRATTWRWRRWVSASS